MDRFIVKVQLSQFSTVPGGQRVLVYNSDRSLRYEAAAGPDELELMSGRAKAYFWASIADGELVLTGQEAPAQPW